MRLDIRIPIGMFFTLVGAVLVVYGLLSDPSVYARSLGYNVNALWGGALLVFGVGMLYAGQRAYQRKAPGAGDRDGVVSGSSRKAS
jgi:multisubunit Na+/H+ antiporter MnhG subunit